MASRNTTRRPNRRQLFASGLITPAPLTLLIHGTLLDAGDTVVQVDVLGRNPVVPARGNDAITNTILLTGIVGGVLSTAVCTEILSGSNGSGLGMTLRFTGEIDQTAPWNVLIPANGGFVTSRNGGHVSGSLDSAHSGAGLPAGGYIVLSDLAVAGVPAPTLRYVISATVVAPGEVDVQCDSGMISPYLISDASKYVVNGADFGVSLADQGGGIVRITYAAVPAPGGVLLMTDWQHALRGAGGDYLAPFRVTLI